MLVGLGCSAMESCGGAGAIGSRAAVCMIAIDLHHRQTALASCGCRLPPSVAKWKMYRNVWQHHGPEGNLLYAQPCCPQQLHCVQALCLYCFGPEVRAVLL